MGFSNLFLNFKKILISSKHIFLIILHVESIPSSKSSLMVNKLEEILLKALSNQVLSYTYGQMFVKIPVIKSNIS